MLPVADLVQQQADLARTVRHDHVHVAVVVNVAERGAPTHFRQPEHGTGAMGHVLELPHAQITDQQVRLLKGKRIVGSERVQVLRHPPVHSEDVQPAVVVVVEPACAESSVREGHEPDARPRALFLEQPGAVVDVEGAPLPAELGDEKILVAIVVEVAGVHPHVGADRTRGTERRTRQERHILEGPIALVDPQLVFPLVVGDEDVDPPVAVEIRSRHTERRPERSRHAGTGGDVGERPVLAVSVEPIRLGAVPLGWAVVWQPRIGKAVDVPVDAVNEVVTHEEIEPPIAVEIHERRRDTPSGVGRAARARHVGKRPVAVVPEQLIRPEVRQVQIHAAVVVVIPCSDAHAISARVETAPIGDVGEP